MQLAGIHHLTAVTAHASKNHAFYTRTLGMRLVKKSVNQDDTSAYHLFYADGDATPGSDLTFFDWPAARERRGTRSIVRTGMRVASEASLKWWAQRFAAEAVTQSQMGSRDGRLTLDFEDFEGQRFSLVVDSSSAPAHPWDKSPVPREHQIMGLGPVVISVPALPPTEGVLKDVMFMRKVREYSYPGDLTAHVFEMGNGGPSAELHVVVEPSAAAARSGAGGVHHVAFRTTKAEYEAWTERLERLQMPSSGPVDRYYFQSLYFREPNGILFELATDEPGFAVDEPKDQLGERLALPPFLEGRRKEIEAGLKPLS
ncbi:MAG: ring-cleaving dioxygenase [Opitutus sp.]